MPPSFVEVHFIDIGHRNCAIIAALPMSVTSGYRLGQRNYTMRIYPWVDEPRLSSFRVFQRDPDLESWLYGAVRRIKKASLELPLNPSHFHSDHQNSFTAIPIAIARYSKITFPYKRRKHGATEWEYPHQGYSLRFAVCGQEAASKKDAMYDRIARIPQQAV